MASPEDLLIASFEAVKVPDTLVTGELDADPIANEIKDTFMQDAIASLHLKEGMSRHLLNIDHGMIIPPSGSHQYSDDFYTRLQLIDVQTLVGTEEVRVPQTLISIERNRDVLNYMVIQFAKFKLGEMAIRRILKYSEFSEEA